jgi:ABC-2 type transport system ATP-binding protein
VPAQTDVAVAATTTRTARSSADDAQYAISVTGLTKRYGARAVVDDIDLQVPRGRLTALIGRNGCGKTTTMAMLLGLIRPTTGEIRVLGAAAGAAPANRVGAMINGPAFYPQLSAHKNLRILSVLAGLPAGRVGDVLDQVGLSTQGAQRVSRYSLGMRQRLGLAAALLTEPDLLILDEPSNGLDPVGARELRTLLRSLVDGGRTVLVSSHLLHELDDISDYVILMDQGTVFRHRSELLSNTDAEILLAAPAPALVRLLDVVTARGFTARVDGRYLRVVADAVRAAELNGLAIEAGVPVSELRVERASIAGLFDAMIDGKNP